MFSPSRRCTSHMAGSRGYQRFSGANNFPVRQHGFPVPVLIVPCSACRKFPVNLRPIAKTLPRNALFSADTRPSGPPVHIPDLLKFPVNRPDQGNAATSYETVAALLRPETLPKSGANDRDFRNRRDGIWVGDPKKARGLAPLSARSPFTAVLRKLGGGPSRNRTGVYGFAVRCVTTPPSGLAPNAAAAVSRAGPGVGRRR